MRKKIITLFGIKFIDANFYFFERKFKKKNLFLVFPAAPALANINNDKKYLASLRASDYALFDSGYLCLLLKIFKNLNVSKFSGLKFLKLFLIFVKKNNLSLLLVDPNRKSSKKNIKLLNSHRIKNFKNYIAPKYIFNNIQDKNLLKFINKEKPKNILINLGGGVQERLGFYLKNKLKFKVNIICTGAAISFLTKEQAHIPDIIDKIYLGWFFRIIFNPKLFFIRYFLAFKLFNIVLKNKIKVC
tara:strand:- start:54 stop:785 length:732 start_codon:yes stop_codon:yes gene_type:complete